jgi:hypothetical protein
MDICKAPGRAPGNVRNIRLMILDTGHNTLQFPGIMFSTHLNLLDCSSATNEGTFAVRRSRSTSTKPPGQLHVADLRHTYQDILRMISLLVICIQLMLARVQKLTEPWHDRRYLSVAAAPRRPQGLPALSKTGVAIQFSTLVQ